MLDWFRERPLQVRVLVYVVLAAMAFALAAGLGAVVALALQGNLGLAGGGESRPADRQHAAPSGRPDNGARQQQTTTELVEADAERTNAEQARAEYAEAVGDIQARAVEATLDSHDKLLRYDALDADDVKEMEANESALEEAVDRASDLEPPEEYAEQYEVFLSAVDELREAARLAYALAADPVAAATEFNVYDGHVDRGADLLQRSNELLGRDHKTIGEVREVSPQL